MNKRKCWLKYDKRVIMIDWPVIAVYTNLIHTWNIFFFSLTFRNKLISQQNAHSYLNSDRMKWESGRTIDKLFRFTYWIGSKFQSEVHCYVYEPLFAPWPAITVLSNTRPRLNTAFSEACSLESITLVGINWGNFSSLPQMSHLIVR